MKILQVLSHLNPGGITTYVYTLSRGLKKRGIEVGVASEYGRLKNLFERENISLFPLPLWIKNEFHPRMWYSLLLLEKVRKRFPFDILHAHTRSSQVLAGIYSFLRGIPYITTCHGYFKRRLSRKIFKCWGIKVIAISPQVREHLLRDFLLPQERAVLIPPGIDFSYLEEEEEIDFRRYYDIKARPFIGSLGRLSSIKNYDLLISAFKIFLKEYPQAFLGIMGEGKEEVRLKNLAESFSLKNRFRIFPHKFRSSFLKALDIFCLPSTREGLGLAVLEAMYYGISCVVSGVGGLKFIVKDIENGVLINQITPEGIYGGLKKVWEDEFLRKKIGFNAPLFVKENFSSSRMVDGIIKIYKEILKK